MNNIIRNFAPLGVILAFVTGVVGQANGGEFSSQYSKLDFENGCDWDEAASEEEAQMGGSALCDGLDGYPVFFAESDLRQFTAYGPVEDPMAFPNGFSEWNSVHHTIEWRMADGRPFATIHRWFLDNIDPDTGSADPARRGQVLTISTVGDRIGSAEKQVSCTVGYVDALANKDANMLAREIADTVGRGFVCGESRPQFYGIRGKLSGTPNALGD